MLLKEARKVAEIVGEADGGCHVCVTSLLGQLAFAFPCFTWERVWDGDKVIPSRLVEVKRSRKEVEAVLDDL